MSNISESWKSSVSLLYLRGIINSINNTHNLSHLVTVVDAEESIILDKEIDYVNTLKKVYYILTDPEKLDIRASFEKADTSSEPIMLDDFSTIKFIIYDKSLDVLFYKWMGDIETFPQDIATALLFSIYFRALYYRDFGICLSLQKIKFNALQAELSRDSKLIHEIKSKNFKIKKGQPPMMSVGALLQTIKANIRGQKAVWNLQGENNETT